LPLLLAVGGGAAKTVALRPDRTRVKKEQAGCGEVLYSYWYSDAMKEQAISKIMGGRSTATRRWASALGLLFVAVQGSGLAASTPRVTLLRAPDGGIQPQAVVDRSGVTHLLYLRGAPDAGDLFYVRQRPGEPRFSSPLRVNSVPGSAVAIGTIRGGQLAVGKGARVHVVWFGSSKARPRGPGDSTPMLYTRLNDAGTAFEPERNLMQTTRLLDGGGSVAADISGNVYATWHAGDGKSEKEADRRLWLVRSRDEGKTFSREVPTSPPGAGACACCLTRAMVDRRGTLFQLYRAARESVDRDMMLVTAKYGGQGFESRSLQPWKIDTCPMSSMSFAEAKSGVIASWETKGQVYFARIDPRTLLV
jgi:hypothetical protein